jgi:hypothetical protein
VFTTDLRGDKTLKIPDEGSSVFAISSDLLLQVFLRRPSSMTTSVTNFSQILEKGDSRSRNLFSTFTVSQVLRKNLASDLSKERSTISI